GAAGGRIGCAHFYRSEALNICMRDFGGLGGLDAFFGGGERTRRDRQRGQDLKVTLELTLDEVAKGAAKTVRLRTLDRCTACGGTGAADGARPTTCGTCGGTGEVRRAARSRSPRRRSAPTSRSRRRTAPPRSSCSRGRRREPCTA